MNYTITLLVSMIMALQTPSVEIQVKNTTQLERKGEMVEVSLSKILSKLSGATPENMIVTLPTGEQIASQISGDMLIFQSTTAPKSTSSYVITTGKPEQYKPLVYSRLVPERKDDWAWENDRIAFRMYGPALEATGEISNGIDVWLKRTNELVINAWYAPGVDYHTDHGQGLDCYKVGRTLGAGAATPLNADTLCLSRNFVKADMVENGALRTTFRLSYAPYKVGDRTVTQQRTISLDAGSNFNKITETFDTPVDIYAGITMRKDGITTHYAQGTSYTEPQSEKDGTTHLAVIMPRKCTQATIQSHVGSKLSNVTTLTYLQGAGWSKFGYPTPASWVAAVENETIKLNNPLKITIK